MTPRLYGHHTDIGVRRHHKLSLVVVIAPQVPYHPSNMQCHYLPSKHQPLSLVTLHVPTTNYYQNITNCPLYSCSSTDPSNMSISPCHQLPITIETSHTVPCTVVDIYTGPYMSFSVIISQLLSNHQLSLVALQVPTTYPSFSVIIHHQNITHCCQQQFLIIPFLIR